VPASKSVASFALDRVRTPIGVLLVVTDEQDRLRATEFEDHEDRMRRSLRLGAGTQDGTAVRKGRAPRAVRDRIEAYFDGRLNAIDAIEIATAGTPFQQQVWRALREIPPGKTMTYGALARRIGADKAIRAVGAANGANPIGVIVPCHRLIGANGSLIHYGGGIERKQWLLQHEGAVLI
jgi:methylated-DNA-[protein]-cysteine S-methyltransferase